MLHLIANKRKRNAASANHRKKTVYLYLPEGLRVEWKWWMRRYRQRAAPSYPETLLSELRLRARLEDASNKWGNSAKSKVKWLAFLSTKGIV